MKPSNVRGSIRFIDNNNISLSLLKWDSPQNQNETDIDFYDIILLRNHSSGTNSIHVAVPRQMKSYEYTMMDGHYTSASITAVDQCGQRSELSEFQLVEVTNSSSTTPGRQNNSTVISLATLLAIESIAIIIIVAFFILFCRRRYYINKFFVRTSICRPSLKASM